MTLQQYLNNKLSGFDYPCSFGLASGERSSTIWQIVWIHWGIDEVHLMGLDEIWGTLSYQLNTPLKNKHRTTGGAEVQSQADKHRRQPKLLQIQAEIIIKILNEGCSQCF